VGSAIIRAVRAPAFDISIVELAHRGRAHQTIKRGGRWLAVMGSASVDNECGAASEPKGLLLHYGILRTCRGSVFQCLESLFHDPDEHSSGWDVQNDGT
jgi:hypothetical protein